MIRTIVSVIFLATAFSVFFTWTQPKLDDIKTLRAQIVDFDNVLVNSKDLEEISANVQDQYNSIDLQDLDRLYKILPSKMEAIKLVLEIENIVKKQGLLLKSINTESPAEKKTLFGSKEDEVEKVFLNIVVSGSYESFVSFLESMDKSLHLIDVQDLNFRAGDVNSYEFTMRALTYWKK